MKLNYDNFEDAKTKLAGTYCMYRGKAFTVNQLSQVPEVENKYMAHGVYMFNGRAVDVSIDDPSFNCSDFTIGYINLMRAAAWFYRVPSKQYKQGLRSDQMRVKASSRAYTDINFQSGKALCSMMENSYPDFKTASELLKSEEANIVAFHKNFAMTLDHIHNDFILEYKGTNIGFTSNLKDLTLMDENAYLIEALREAVG